MQEGSVSEVCLSILHWMTHPYDFRLCLLAMGLGQVIWCHEEMALFRNWGCTCLGTLCAKTLREKYRLCKKLPRFLPDILQTSLCVHLSDLPLHKITRKIGAVIPCYGSNVVAPMGRPSARRTKNFVYIDIFVSQIHAPCEQKQKDRYHIFPL